MNSKIPLNLFNKLETRLRRYLQSRLESNPSVPVTSTCTQYTSELLADDEVLAATIESLHITEEGGGDEVFNDDTVNSRRNIKVYLYKYPEQQQQQQSTRTLDSSVDPSDPDASPFYSTETFPNAAYKGLWESLEFDSAVKSSVLSYITAIFKFSLAGLTEHNDISFNRILLLHGPPGTGKLVLMNE